MLAATKALLFLGILLLVGGGVFARLTGAALWRGAPPAARRRLYGGVLLGATLLLLASGLDVLLTIHNTLGFVTSELAGEYLRATRHGNAVVLRLALLVVTSGTALPGSRSSSGGIRHATCILFGISGLALLATFSWTSHAVAMGGRLPMTADLLHLTGATTWGGSLLYLSVLPLWQGPQEPLREALGRLSGIGLVSVLLLAATGTYAGFLHIQSPQILSGSPYGRTLMVKVGLVAIIIAVAAYNRLRLLPEFRRRGSSKRLPAFLRIEALLVITVLGITGVLTTSALPHS